MFKALKTIIQCNDVNQQLAEKNKLTLIKVPVDEGIIRQWVGDKGRAETSFIDPQPFCGIPKQQH